MHRPEYEVRRANTIRVQIKAAEADAEARIGALERELAECRKSNADWYALLRGTGRELVEAVIRALRSFGFRNVIDVDDEEREKGNEGNLREDIRVDDTSPILVVDVKGVRGTVEDAEATQAEKHALMRARDMKRTDVQALTIINAERHLPPHERDPHPYRKELIENSRQTGSGLMTTWDLARIVRNREALGWPEHAVKAIFYRIGRIEPVPEHYRDIGRVVKVWQPAFGIIPTKPISVGARLAVETGDVFTELPVGSLQVDDEPRETAPAGSECGVGCEGTNSLMREGMRVFLIVDSGEQFSEAQAGEDEG